MKGVQTLWEPKRLERVGVFVKWKTRSSVEFLLFLFSPPHFVRTRLYCSLCQENNTKVLWSKLLRKFSYIFSVSITSV